MARKLVESAEADGISVLKAFTECKNSMSHVGRYHNSLHFAYKKSVKYLLDPKPTLIDYKWL